MKTLSITQFGNPILRKTAKKLSKSEILSEETQNLINQMRHTLVSKKLGIGLAAPQVGKNISLAVVSIRPTAHRPKVKEVDLVIINPKLIETYGEKKSLWEGCISAGSNGTADLFAKVPRYSKVKIQYTDENGVKKEKLASGLMAQVLQHEIDHLNGVLFVDNVTDTKTFMTYDEYRKRITK